MLDQYFMEFSRPPVNTLFMENCSPTHLMQLFQVYRYYMAFYCPSYEFINQTLKSVLHPDISLLMGKFCKLNVRYILACCLVHCLSLALSRLHIMGFSKTLTRFLLCLDIDGWMFQYQAFTTIRECSFYKFVSIRD